MKDQPEVVCLTASFDVTLVAIAVSTMAVATVVVVRIVPGRVVVVVCERVESMPIPGSANEHTVPSV